VPLSLRDRRNYAQARSTVKAERGNQLLCSSPNLESGESEPRRTGTYGNTLTPGPATAAP